MTPLPFLNFIHKPKNELEKGGRTAALVQEDASEPEKTCPNCHKSIPLSRLWSNWNTCACGYHFRMGGRQRLRFLADKGSFQELFSQVEGRDPLSFPGYREKLEMVRDASSEKEAVLCGTARIGGAPCCLFIMEPYFMMGSMGTAVGEKITSLFEYATEHSLPVVGYTVSGGVTASFAMEGDIILAEPGATVGFAGARVVEQTTRKALPKGFQTAEFLLKHGFVDAIVPRRDQQQVVSSLLKLHQRGEAL